MVVRLPVPVPPVIRDLVPGVITGPDVDPAGKRVLVTGASGTFGRAIAQALVDRGARVVGLDLSPHEDDPVPVIPADITQDDSVHSAVRRAIDELGGLDILINNAGIGGPAPAERAPDAEVARQLEINLLGTWRVTAAATDALVASRGRVVIVASRAAVFALPIAAAYGVSKRAVVAYADALRLELAPAVTVSTIYPSMVRSPIHDSTRHAGLSLEGVSRYESLEGVVDAIVGAALARDAPRDVATSGRGMRELLIARHLPALLDRVVIRTVAGILDSGAYDDAELARDMVRRRRGTPTAAATSRSQDAAPHDPFVQRRRHP